MEKFTGIIKVQVVVHAIFFFIWPVKTRIIVIIDIRYTESVTNSKINLGIIFTTLNTIYRRLFVVVMKKILFQVG